MICYLIRHGKDDETVRGGWSKSGLVAEGKLQAKNLADYVSENKDKLKIEKLFSSDLPRAIETAMPISSALNLNVILKPEFRETNNGILAGMPNDIANEKYPGIYWSALDWDESYPQGESPRAFYERIKAAWEAFSEAIIKDGRNTALVTHNGVINVILAAIEEREYSNSMKMERIDYATMIAFKYDGGWKRL